MVDPPLPASILTTHMVQAFQAGLHSPLSKFADVRIVVREESCSYDKTSDVVHSLRDDIKNVLNPESHCDGESCEQCFNINCQIV